MLESLVDPRGATDREEFALRTLVLLIASHAISGASAVAHMLLHLPAIDLVVQLALLCPVWCLSLQRARGAGRGRALAVARVAAACALLVHAAMRAPHWGVPLHRESWAVAGLWLAIGFLPAILGLALYALPDGPSATEGRVVHRGLGRAGFVRCTVVAGIVAAFALLAPGPGGLPGLMLMVARGAAASVAAFGWSLALAARSARVGRHAPLALATSLGTGVVASAPMALGVVMLGSLLGIGGLSPAVASLIMNPVALALVLAVAAAPAAYVLSAEASGTRPEG